MRITLNEVDVRKAMAVAVDEMLTDDFAPVDPEDGTFCDDDGNEIPFLGGIHFTVDF